MALIIWDEKLFTGHDLIDQQHRCLVETFNRLHSAMMQGKGKQELEGILAFLQDFIKVHFETEETLMKDCHYSDLANHREGHALLRTRVRDTVTRFKEDPALMTLPVIQLLNDYLVDHLREDLHFGDEMRAKGILLPPVPPAARREP